MRYLKQGQARADVDRRSADVSPRVTEILGVRRPSTTTVKVRYRS